MLESGLTEERLQEAFTRYFEYRIGKTDVGWSRDRVEKELGMSWNHFCCLRNLHNHLNNIVTDEFWYIDRDK